jgi:hypothetical protein
LILSLTLALVSQAMAQESAATTTSATSTTTATAGRTSSSSDAETKEAGGTEQSEEAEPTPQSSHDTRNQFFNVLSQHPPELGTILALDPTLLSNDAFLAGYPELAKFIAKHPEVRHTPRFFLDNYQWRESRRADDVLEGLFIMTMISLFAFIFSWLVRTILDQRRWSRLARTQADVHTKILDRFGTSSELLEYMKTPAGSKFLESAPIPVREASVAQNAPASRVVWSIQLGIVVAAGALGLMLVSGRFDKEGGSSLYALGAVALCVGAGFIASAIVSVVVSRRLGLWQGPSVAELEDSGSVR